MPLNILHARLKAVLHASNMQYPSVFIIVLNYRMRDQLRQCLLSLRELTYTNFKIIVVDNDSGDDVETMVREEFNEAYFIQTGANIGYTGGNNAGIRFAIAHDADYVLILNPDTVIADCTFLDKMIGYTEANTTVGIAGPTIYLRETSTIQNTICFTPGLTNNIFNWFRWRLKPQSLHFSGDLVIDTPVLNGVCLLMRTNCLLETGLFDEEIFMYIEDADLNHRARMRSWRVVYLPIPGIIHMQKKEGYELTSDVSFLLKRNSVYYLNKYNRKKEAFVFAILTLLLMFIRGIIKFDKRYFSFCQRLFSAYIKIAPHSSYLLTQRRKEAKLQR